MKTFMLLLVLSATAITGGCTNTHNKPKPSLSESFVTTIDEHGSKRFDFRISQVHSAHHQGKTHKDKSSKGKKRRGDSNGNKEQRQKERFYTMLSEKLQKTGFCREGYMELNSEFARGNFRLVGECRETANKKDRAEFPNTVPFST